MASKQTNDKKSSQSRRPPATTPEARENQLISSAVDLAEKQLQEGSASAQVITHYLKLGSSREKLEQERIANENSLLVAKREAMASAEKVEKLYESAIEAMRAYAGHDPFKDSEDMDEPDD